MLMEALVLPEPLDQIAKFMEWPTYRPVRQVSTFSLSLVFEIPYVVRLLRPVEASVLRDWRPETVVGGEIDACA